MGLVYEITGDTAILDQMISFCDAVLSERNDLAPDPVGQYVIWTGRIDPVFFSSGVQTYQDSAGNTAYNWGYALPSTSGEDSNHGRTSFDFV
jgi:hypothetical protein